MSDVWDAYRNRITVHGYTQRDRVLYREQRMIAKKIPDNLSYFTVTIDGEEQNVAIIDGSSFNEKTILSMPRETFPCGGLVEWMDNHWLITEKDANMEVYAKGSLLQCNYLLKWIDDEGVIQEHWCALEDGTVAAGEGDNTDSIAMTGDYRLALTIQRNEDTAKLTRENRFIIDDSLTGDKHAVQLTKPVRVGGVYNDEGIYEFVLTETYTTDYDNFDLCIADYYRYFSDEDTGNEDESEGGEDEGKGRGGWL